MRKYITISLLLLIACTTSAQVPGYKGKKMLVKYNMGSFFGFINSYSSTGDGYKGYQPVFHHYLSAEYTISTRATAGLSYKYQNSRLYFESGDSRDDEVVEGRLVAHTIGAYIKRFKQKRGYLAPVGRYLNYQLKGALYKGVDKDDKLVCDGGNCDDQLGPYGDVIFTLGVGRHFLLFERMIIDLGMDLSFPIVSMISQSATYDHDYDVHSRYYFSQFVQVKIGIGFLAF